MKNLFLYSLICLLISCTTAKKATDYLNKHPEVAANYCAEKFPVRDSVGLPVIDSSKKADNKDYTHQIDSLQSEISKLESDINAIAESNSDDVYTVQIPLRKEILKLQQQIAQLKKKGEKLQQQYKPCIPDTVYKSIPVYRENTAKVKAQEIEIIQLKTKLADTKKSRNIWRLIAIVLIVLDALYVLLKTKKII